VIPRPTGFMGYPNPSPTGLAIAQARAQQPALSYTPTDPALRGVFSPGVKLPPRTPSRDRNGLPQTGTAVPRPGAPATLLASAPITTDKTRSADIAAAIAKRNRLALGGSY